MTHQSENERRLNAIQADVKEIKEFLIGTTASDGIFTRLTKVEERQGFLVVCYGWLLAGLVSLSAGVAWVGITVVSLFRDQK